MPRNKRGRKGARGDSCLVPFHTLSTSPLTAGSLAVLLAPVAFISPRALTEADAWAHFRVPRLRFRLHPGTLNALNQAAGYVGGVQDAPPATIAQVMELLPSVYLADELTIPTNWVRVSQTDLSGPFPWYKTLAGAADVTEEAPGQIVFGGTGTDVVTIEFEGVFEFKTAVAAGNTPLSLKLREQLRQERLAGERSRERTTLLQILGSTTPQGKPA